jgi:hypothetical protein
MLWVCVPTVLSHPDMPDETAVEMSPKDLPQIRELFSVKICPPISHGECLNWQNT